MRAPTNALLKRRMEITFIFLMLLFFALALRLVWLQGVRQPHFTKLAEKFHEKTLRLPSARGPIIDRRGQEIVSSIEAKTLSANPRVVNDKPRVAEQIAQILGGSPEKYLKALSRETTADGKPVWFTYLARAADRKKVEAVMALKIPGLYAWAEPKRIYPSGPLASHVIGFVDVDGKGREGLERKLDRWLHGRDGELRTEVDAIGRPIPDTREYYRPPVNGKPVRLTLDSNIQEFAEAELEKIGKNHAPEAAVAIVEDLRSGEILSIANYPTFDPNQPGTAPPLNRRNRAVQDWYEPGSTFKTLTIAAALEEGLTDISVNCTGAKAVGVHTIGEAHNAHGRVDLHGIEEQSCNIGAATVGLRLGPHKLYRTIKRFGFLEPTGIELLGDQPGSFGGVKPEDWRDIRTANVAFGQGVSVTYLAMLRMYAAIANDGVMVPPTILSSIGGKSHQPTTLPRRVMRPENARKLTSYMEDVVVGKHGTGKNAKIPYYRVAGKTGTAQLVKEGRYVSGAYIGSFIGFLPVSRPRIAILVAVIHPTKGGYYGGVVAAPAFREIARQSMAYLGIPQDSPGDIRDGAKRSSFANWERKRAGLSTEARRRGDT